MSKAVITNQKDPLVVFSGIKDSYTYSIRHYIKWMRAGNREINTESLFDYFVDLQDSGYCAGTVRNMRMAVKARMRQMYENRPLEEQERLEGILRKLDKKVKAPKTNSNAIPRDKVISRDEYPELIRNCRTARQVLFVSFLWQTGCRVSEMTRAELKNCKPVGEDIEVRVMGKGKNERKVMITSELFEQIKETFQGKRYLFETQAWRNKKGGKPFQREYVSNQVKRIGKRIDKNISAHILRHSFGTRMVKEHPEKLDSISKYLGHSNVNITLEFYCHSDLSHDDLFC